MMQIPQSTFLQALGCAIVNSLWQFALLWLMFFLTNLFFRLSSKQKYSAALLLQLTGFLWFAGTFLFYYQQWNNVFYSTEYINEYSWYQLNVGGDTAKDLWLRWLSESSHYLPYLSIAYLLLLSFLSIKWIQSYLYTKQIKQTGLSKINVDWRLFVQKISAQLGIDKKVSIYLSEIVKAPLTIGFFKPVILIPLASINHLSVDQMEAVILHELAHIKRFDYLINLLLTLVEMVMFFNPFMQLLSRQIKRERENSCDDWVLQYEYNAATYAKALLKIAQLQVQTQPSFAMAASTANKNVLLTRVKRMIEKQEKTFHYKHHLLALLFTTIILSFIAWFSRVDTNYTTGKQGKRSDLWIAPMSMQVDNPLFNPVFFLSDPQKDKVEIQQKRIATKEMKSIRHSPSLAIPEMSELLKLNKISLPVIINPVLIKERIALVPKINFSIDTLLEKIRVRNFYTIAGINQIGKTEKEFIKTLSDIQKNLKSNQLYNKEKLVQTMKTALAQIKATKTKLLKDKASKALMTSGNFSDAEDLDAILKMFESDTDVEAYAEQITRQFEELKLQYTLAKMNEDLNGRSIYRIPAVVREIPSSHTYSFEYGDTPRERSVSITSAQAATRSRATVRERTNNTAIENQETADSVSAPLTEQPVKRVTKKHYTIHI